MNIANKLFRKNNNNGIGLIETHETPIQGADENEKLRKICQEALKGSQRIHLYFLSHILDHHCLAFAEEAFAFSAKSESVV